CEAVSIIAAGHLVASGPVEELRARGARGTILRVQVDAPPAWADSIPRVHRDGSDDGALLLRLDDDADEQAVLDAARSAGPAHHSARVEPTLAELFREAVTA